MEVFFITIISIGIIIVVAVLIFVVVVSLGGGEFGMEIDRSDYERRRKIRRKQYQIPIDENDGDYNEEYEG